jgi:hypothetical protein
MKWISIEDYLPEQGYYLFATKTEGVRCGFIWEYQTKYKRPEAQIENRSRQFTHWMPLPELPEK